MKHSIRPIIALLLLSVFALSSCGDDDKEQIEDPEPDYPQALYPDAEEQQPFSVTNLHGYLRFDEEIQKWVIRPMQENFGHPSINSEREDGLYMIVTNMKSEYEKYTEITFSGQTNLSHYIVHNAAGQRTYVYNTQLTAIKHYLEVDPPSTPPQYQVARLNINTENAAPILSKDKADYVNCTIAINSETEEWNYAGAARIRGRGNSTWAWYPKKPYRIKLDNKAEILGLAAEKDWVLLANYRDPTHIMNTFVFTAGQQLALPYTNHSRYVEVMLNGEYIGLYLLTEQIEQGSSRVAIDKTEGILLSLDADDGPQHSPTATDNFWSTVYRVPVCVKHPEEITAAQKTTIQTEFAKLEQAIKSGEYNAVAKLMNIPVFIDFMLIQELVYNVEVDAPRSIYMHKDAAGLWTMGPLWDFDAGFDFDWSTMYTGHNYFSNHRELVLGTNPVNHTGGYHVPDFFTDLFRNKRFVNEYKARWSEIRGKIMSQFWQETYIYVEHAQDAMKRNATRWPIDKNYQTETGKMKQWLEQRIGYLDTVISNYPAGTK